MTPSCQHIHCVMDELAANTLPPDERERAEQHLKTCSKCRSALETWRDLTRDLRNESPQPFDQLTARRIVIAATSPSGSGTRSSRSKPLAWSIAAAGFTALAISAYFFLSTKELANPIDPTPIAIQATQQTEETSGNDQPAFSFTPHGKDSRKFVDLAPGALLWLGPNAQWLQRDDMPNNEIRIELSHGTIIADIGPAWSGGRFVIATSDAEVEARGTVYSVEARANKPTKTTVLGGVVEVRTVSKVNTFTASHIVTAGQTAIADNQPARAATEDELLTTARIVGSVESNTPSIETEDIQSEPLTLKVTPPRAISKRKPRQQPRQVNDSAHWDQSDVLPSVDPEPTTDEHAASLLHEAMEYRERGLFKKAALAYESILSDNPQNAAALVSLAQLELVELSEPRQALKHFEQYLELHPKGFLSETARAGSVRACYRLGLLEKLVKAAKDHTEHHPAGPFGAEVSVLEGDALRQLGNCNDAIGAYKRVISLWPTSTFVERAENGIAHCR